MTVQVDPNEGRRSDFCEFWDDKRGEIIHHLSIITGMLMNPNEIPEMSEADLEHVLKDCGKIINKVAEVSAACTAVLTIKRDPIGVASGKYRSMNDPDFADHVKDLWKEGIDIDAGKSMES